MTYARTAIQDFSTANKLYVNAEVTAYLVVDGEKTNIKANLYNSISGNAKIANPQQLDSFGKFRNPVYIDQPVILTIRNLGNVQDHETGVLEPSIIYSGQGTPEGVVVADRGVMYLRTDGGAGTTLYIKESGDGTNTGWVAK